MTEPRQPWERQPYESQADFAIFQLYLEQDAPRSVNEAYRKWLSQKGDVKARLAPGSWRNLANGKKRNGGAEIPGAMTWTARALAWDDHVADLERQKWIKRRLEIKEQEWEVGSKLLQRGREMLQFPIVTAESQDGRTIIMPAGWKLKDIPQVVSTGSKLSRLAADMVTDSIELDWREEARKDGIDPDAIFNKLVDELAARMEGGNVAGSDGSSESENQPQES
jgi:hypothetical protein